MKFKLITYNIWHGAYFEEVKDFLRSEAADIVCIQEIGRDGLGFARDSTDMVKVMGRELDMRGEYEEMFRGNIGQGEYGFGVAIFSRFTLIEKRILNYELESREVLEPAIKDRYNLPRRLIGLRYEELGDLWVFTTHFTITPDTLPTEHQLTQAKVVQEYVSHYHELILCGDMNTVPDTETYRMLSQGMMDVSLPEKPTLHPRIHLVGDKGYHVDYVFYRSSRLKHVSTRIPLVDGSDHLPIVVEFELEE